MRPFPFHIVLPVVVPAALLVGCSTSGPKDSGFSGVQSAIAERTGQRVQWNRHAADDRAVAAAVRELLAKGLDADRAVQVALLNNRRLQATYESLGVAQAEVVQAGLLKNPVFDGDVKFGVDGGGTKIELAFQHIGILSLEFHVDKLSRPLL